MTNPLNKPDINPFDLAKEAARQISEITGIQKYDIAVTLGSGWGKAAEMMGLTTHAVLAQDIVGFNGSKVAGHSGTLRSITLPNQKHVLVIGARTHFYESYEPYHVRQVVHSVRTASALGCQTMILTNGAGSINTDWTPGTVVAIKDHINLTGISPLEGATFIDLTDVYSEKLRSIVKTVEPRMPEGVYVQNRGPHYETPAEVQMAKSIGGDIVGMSTALEAIAAREVGMEVLAMSLITNHAAGTITNQSLNHQEVLETGKSSEEKLANLLSTIVNQVS